MEHTEILKLRVNNNSFPMFLYTTSKQWEEAEEPCASINFAQHITFLVCMNNFNRRQRRNLLRNKVVVIVLRV